MIMETQIGPPSGDAYSTAHRVIDTGGMLGKLTKLVLETALETEMTAHLGYEAHDPAGRNRGTRATAAGRRRSSPRSARSRSTCPVTGTAA